MCNCKGKGKSQVMNNLDNVDVINYAKQIYQNIILPNTTGEYSDLDKIEIIGAYSSLYPNAKTTPSVADAIEHIKIGIELYDDKQRKRFKR
jgi:hypothetical protein